MRLATWNIGEDEKNPVFCVTDLLIHLAHDRMEKKADVVIEGEALDILVGSQPLKGEEKDAVAKNILSILKEKYDVEEEVIRKSTDRFVEESLKYRILEEVV